MSTSAHPDPTDKPLADQVAIVIGGGGAIGGAIACRLARLGAAVAVVDAHATTAQTVAQAIHTQGGAAIAHATDITRHDQVQAMTQAVASQLGGVDILINSAGGSARQRMKLFHEQDIDVIDWMLDVNLRGPLYCIRAAVGHMIARQRGRIINITSNVATGGWKRCVEYGAAKGGLQAATRSLAMELGQHNITVNCVSPGLIQRPAELPQDARAFARRTSFVNRIGTQEDIAHMVAHLALPASDFITGQNYIVDGGRSLGLKDRYPEDCPD